MASRSSEGSCRLVNGVLRDASPSPSGLAGARRRASSLRDTRSRSLQPEAFQPKASTRPPEKPRRFWARRTANLQLKRALRGQQTRRCASWRAEDQDKPDRTDSKRRVNSRVFTNSRPLIRLCCKHLHSGTSSPASCLPRARCSLPSMEREHCTGAGSGKLERL
jgi:hypothetical protein